MGSTRTGYSSTARVRQARKAPPRGRADPAARLRADGHPPPAARVGRARQAVVTARSLGPHREVLARRLWVARARGHRIKNVVTYFLAPDDASLAQEAEDIVLSGRPGDLPSKGQDPARECARPALRGRLSARPAESRCNRASARADRRLFGWILLSGVHRPRAAALSASSTSSCRSASPLESRCRHGVTLASAGFAAPDDLAKPGQSLEARQGPKARQSGTAAADGYPSRASCSCLNGPRAARSSRSTTASRWQVPPTANTS